jgi:thiazole/oxazole-forming peptide maturase SagD family component
MTALTETVHSAKTLQLTTSAGTHSGYLSPRTAKLLRRMVNPLCGLSQGIGFVTRSRHEPRLVVAGAELTGVHVLLGQPEAGSYHIGGAGVFLEEAVIRALGETVERYCQLVSCVGGQEIVVASSEELIAQGRRALAVDRLAFFSAEQLGTPGFPFEPLEPDASYGWIPMQSLVNDSVLLVPAQLVLVGYEVRRRQGEPWLTTAVTTGTAAHVDHDRASRNALLELIQVDAAIGHWYGVSDSPEIVLDARTHALERLIERSFARERPMPRFHQLRSADLDAHVVACVMEEYPGRVPAVGVGLGADLNLEEAMYKALLEAAGVMQLAKIGLVMESVSGTGVGVDPKGIFDLDSNVAYYARPENAALVRERFATGGTVRASALSQDSAGSPAQDVRRLVADFAGAGHELLALDLTTQDAAQLGFVTCRVWSPDTLSLCLPSAPPLLHPRFRAYGGVVDRGPHPYA